MVISFKFLQCKRAHPPEIEDVIAIRKIRERRIERRRIDIERRRIEDVEPLEGIYDYRANPFYIDTITHKRCKVTKSPNEHEILKMLKFYGVDINKKHQCPICSYEGNIRALLPHLNNTDRTPDVFYADESEYLGELTPKVDKPASGTIMTPSGRSFVLPRIIVEPIRSHGWNFKQIGEWMAKEGY